MNSTLHVMGFDIRAAYEPDGDYVELSLISQIPQTIYRLRSGSYVYAKLGPHGFKILDMSTFPHDGSYVLETRNQYLACPV
jgi:hypothetical protein